MVSEVPAGSQVIIAAYKGLVPMRGPTSRSFPSKFRCGAIIRAIRS